MTATRFLVSPCLACLGGRDSRACLGLSRLSRLSVSGLFSFNKVCNPVLSRICRDLLARRFVDGTRRGYGFPPLGGEPSLPPDTPGTAFPVFGGFWGSVG